MGRGKRKKKNKKKIGGVSTRMELPQESPGRSLGELPLAVRLKLVDVFQDLAADARQREARVAKRADIRRAELEADETLTGNELEAVRLRRSGLRHLLRVGACSTICGKRVPPRLRRELERHNMGAAPARPAVELADCAMCLDAAQSSRPTTT